eukprot:EG_transcript_18511
MRNIKHWQNLVGGWAKICVPYKADQLKFRVWLRQVLDDRREPQAFWEDIFSHHIVHCDGQPPRKQFLEPLAAALRNPLFPCSRGSQSAMLDTSYLLFPYVIDFPHSNAYFFDVGSTFFDSGVVGYLDSLKWFMEVFRQRGFTFSEIYAWEVEPLNGTSYWRRVPDSFKHKMHFFNAAASSDPKSPMNPLTLVKQVALPDDFVVFKLDIDNNEVEVQLIQQLLHDRRLLGLVDELFWENHVRNHPMQWQGAAHLRGPCSTFAGSYQCFRRLRAAGIRAHSWI